MEKKTKTQIVEIYLKPTFTLDSEKRNGSNEEEKTDLLTA